MENTQEFKRNIAYKLNIGNILAGTPQLESDKLKHLQLGEKQIIRTNVIANITDKYIQDGEKKFASLTIDDASGQIKLKLFGEDIKKLEQFSQGDTISIIGLLRSWNNELYITPEIIKKRDPAFLLIRKKELDREQEQINKTNSEKNHSSNIRMQMLSLIKANDEKGGLSYDQLSSELKSSADILNSEIRKLLEEGLIYEPRPGILRYLG
jgi:RPA family protein